MASGWRPANMFPERWRVLMAWILLVVGLVILGAGLFLGYGQVVLEGQKEDIEAWVYNVTVPLIVAGAIAMLAGAIMLLRSRRRAGNKA